MSKQCPVSNLMCWHPPCKDGCLMEKAAERTPEELMAEFHQQPLQYIPGPQPIVIHIHNEGIASLVQVLLSINQKLNNMPTKADFDAFAAQINQSTTDLGGSLDNIATDITTLTDRLSGGLTPDETTAVAAEFSGLADKVKALADAAKAIADRTPDAPVPEPTA